MALEAMKIDMMNQGRLLTQQELNQKIECVAAEVLQDASSPADGGPMCPRIISAADLVRRMKPFMVYN